MFTCCVWCLCYCLLCWVRLPCVRQQQMQAKVNPNKQCAKVLYVLYCVWMLDGRFAQIVSTYALNECFFLVFCLLFLIRAYATNSLSVLGLIFILFIFSLNAAPEHVVEIDLRENCDQNERCLEETSSQAENLHNTKKSLQLDDVCLKDTVIIKGEKISSRKVYTFNQDEDVTISGCTFTNDVVFNCFNIASLKLNETEFHSSITLNCYGRAQAQIDRCKFFASAKTTFYYNYASLKIHDCEFYDNIIVKCHGQVDTQIEQCKFHGSANFGHTDEKVASSDKRNCLGVVYDFLNANKFVIVVLIGFALVCIRQLWLLPHVLFVVFIVSITKIFWDFFKDAGRFERIGKRITNDVVRFQVQLNKVLTRRDNFKWGYVAILVVGLLLYLAIATIYSISIVDADRRLVQWLNSLNNNNNIKNRS